MNTDIALRGIRGSGNADPETAQRESRVQSQMGNLGTVATALSTQVEQLETRLGGVISPGCPDTPENKPSAPEQNLCQLGNDLREIVRSLSGTPLRLQQIMDNLEL